MKHVRRRPEGSQISAFDEIEGDRRAERLLIAQALVSLLLVVTLVVVGRLVMR